MSKENQYKNLVESYLDGELTPEEVISFEKELAENSALQEEMEFYQLAHSVVLENKFNAIEDAIAEAKHDFIKDRRKKTIQKAIVVSIAIVGLGLAGVYYFTQNDKQENNSKPQKESLIVPTEVNKDSVHVSQTEVPQPTVEVKNVDSPKTFDTPKSKPAQVPATEKTIEKSEQNIPLSSKTEAPIDQQKTVFENQNTEPTPKPKTNPCEGVSITANTNLKSACVGQNNGEIRISTLKGGTTPYQFELSSGDKNSNGMFTELASGNYKIKIIDKNFCETTIDKLIITEEFCKLDLFYDPSTGNEVRFPIYEKEGVLSIFDKGGNLKFTKTIHANDEFNWDATTNNSVLAAGYYIFIIKYENGKTQNGSITVTP